MNNKYDKTYSLATTSGWRGFKARVVLVFRLIKALRRLRYNLCPACNSDAPAIDTCRVCKSYRSSDALPYPPGSDNRFPHYPPSPAKKEIWLAHWYKKEYDYIMNGGLVCSQKT